MRLFGGSVVVTLVVDALDSAGPVEVTEDAEESARRDTPITRLEATKPEQSAGAVGGLADERATLRRLVCDHGYDVLSTRPTLTMRRRLSLLARARLRWKFDNDPLSAFDQMTDLAVNDAEGGHTDGCCRSEGARAASTYAD
ncbi:hypothetical protein [Halobaculum limi]|uniref:hypothetical protein n=1 Tax=Halobaculum limi TaxID=3031916 RepID=UPI0024059B0B|nr:hypothetical protein [Halobaculum sp. YSMS11]